MRFVRDGDGALLSSRNMMRPVAEATLVRRSEKVGKRKGPAFQYGHWTTSSRQKTRKALNKAFVGI